MKRGEEREKGHTSKSQAVRVREKLQCMLRRRADRRQWYNKGRCSTKMHRAEREQGHTSKSQVVRERSGEKERKMRSC